MNNTVSPKQVEAITREVDEIMSAAKVKAENIGSGYLNKVKDLWADTGAVTFAKDITMAMDNSINLLANGGNTLKDGVVNIANFYAEKAGKATMSSTHLSFNSAINPSVVKDTFAGSDEYGFKDPSAIGAIVGEATALADAYKKLGEETSSRLSAINAFGNPEIKTKLLSTANNVFNGLVTAGKEIEKTTESRLQAAAKDYNIGDVGSFFKNAVVDAGTTAASIGSGAVELGKTAVEDPQLFKDAFIYAATGKDNRNL